MPGSDDLLTRVKENLKVLGGSDTTDRNVQDVISNVRHAGQKVLLQNPRRGIHYEYKHFLHDFIKPQLVQEATAAGIHMEAPIHPAPSAIGDLARAEQWREVEYLTVRPPTFAALKQLPELQQVIAATAVDVIRQVSQSNNQVTVMRQLYSQAMEVGPLATSSLQRVVRNPAPSARRSTYNNDCRDGSLSLTLQLSPHLRLALAAEVAAGMLCPGQPAPPDTPEHGNTLKMFLVTGYVALTKELKDHETLAKAANSSSSRRSKPKRTQLQKLWAHTASTPQQQQQQQQDADAAGGSSSLSTPAAAAAAGASVLLPSPSQVRRWPLSPHIDLQLQLPPDLLLLYAVLAPLGLMQKVQLEWAAGGQQQQQQQQQVPSQNEHCDRLWHQLSQRVQCQGTDDESLKAVAMLLREDVLYRLLVTLYGMKGQARQTGSSSSSNGGGIGLPEPAASSAATSADAAAAAAAEAEAMAAATAARAAEDGRLPQALARTVMQLAFRSLLELLAVGDQQQVPLQALQLLAAVRQLELTAQEVCNTATQPPPSPPAAAAAASDVEGSAAAPTEEPAHQAAQQQLVQQSLQLLQHVRAIEAHSATSRTAEQTTAAGAASGRSGATNGWESSSSASSNSSSTALLPSQFFAADGPLSSCWGREPAELPGLWQVAPDPGAHGATVNGDTAVAEGAPEAGCSSHARGLGSSSGTSGHQLRGGSRQAHQQQQVQQVLRASALSCAAQRQASAVLEDLLGLKQLSYAFEEIDAVTCATREVSMQITGPEFTRCEGMLEQAAGHRAAVAGSDVLLRSWCLHEPLVSLMAHARSAICSMLALPVFDAVAWQRLASVGRRFDDEHMADYKGRQDGAEGRAGSKQQPGSDSSSDSSDSDSDGAEDTDSTTAAAAGSSRASRCSSNWSSSGNSSSRTNSSFSRRHWQSVLADALTQQHVQRMLSGKQLSSEAQEEQAQRRESVVQAASTLRDMAGSAAAKLSPLQHWHQQHIQRQQQAAVQAQKWWDSRDRVAAAVAAATGPAKRKQGTVTAAATAAAAAAAAAAGEDPEGMQAASGSSSTELWPNGFHDSNPQCPLCQDELKQQQQQQQQQHPAGGNSGSSTGSVPYDDPFLWRRLLWRLLGRLSPEAQAFHAHYLNMCPHACSKSNWRMVVGSIERCLWAGGVDVVDKVLASPEGLVSGNRTRLLRQYSRVVNAAFCKAYHPSTVLVSKQVLLALSPLHHQVLPPPEVAHYLPSSFQPAIGKALMQQLLQAPVMSGYQHQHCSLQLWHMWWHVGLRRHRWLQQLQRQRLCNRSKGSGHQQPHSNPTTANNDSSSSAGGGSSSAGWSIHDLYLDADARLYAVGFATRQLTGTSKLPKDHAGALSLGNSLAHRAARQLLHDTAASMLSTAILTGGTLQDPAPGTNSKLATLLPEVISKLYVVPGVLAEGEPLLQLAVTGPTDPLVPLQQQRELLPVRCIDGKAGGRRCNEKAVERMLYEKVHARHFMRLGCPQQWQQYQRELGAQLQHQQQDSSDSDVQDSNEQQQEDARPQQQQQQGSEGEQQQRRRDLERDQRRGRGAPVVRGSDDMSQLMLLDPVPAECLLGPEVWWAWHEELTGLNSCDMCGKEVNVEATWSCGTCHGALYCSKACGDEDDQHDKICDKLINARRRYAPTSHTISNSSSAGGALNSPQQQQQQQQPAQGLPRVPGLPIITGLLQPPLHEPGPLGHAAATPEDWPDMFGQMDEIIRALARSSTS